MHLASRFPFQIPMIDQHAAAKDQHPEGTHNRPAPSIAEVLKNRHFLKLWMAQVMSQTAQQIVNIALVVQVDKLTHSSTAVSGIILSFTIPAVLFAALAGVFVERNSKKTMLVLTNLGRGIMALAYVFTDPAWGVGAVLPIFYVVTFLFATVSQFFNPAEASLIPLLVKKRDLVAANSLFNLTLTGTMLGGFVLIGPILVATVFKDNFNGLYFIIFLFCLFAALLTYFLPQDKPEDTAAARRKRGEKVGVGSVAAGAGEIARSGAKAAWDELVEGWHFIRADRVIVSAIIYWSVAIAVFMMLGTIGPGFINRVLGLDQSEMIYILLPGGVGLLAGVILVGRISHEGNRETMINWSLFGAGILLIVFAITDPLLHVLYDATTRSDPPAYLILAIMGFMTLMLGMLNSFISVPAQTALQERSPEQIRARVFSAFYTVSNAMIVVPVVLAATSADRLLGYVPTVAAIGVVVLLVAGLGLYRSRRDGGAGARAAGGAQSPMNGQVTPEEAEAALTIATPAPRPIPASEQQKEFADLDKENK